MARVATGADAYTKKSLKHLLHSTATLRDARSRPTALPLKLMIDEELR